MKLLPDSTEGAAAVAVGDMEDIYTPFPLLPFNPICLIGYLLFPRLRWMGVDHIPPLSNAFGCSVPLCKYQR
jgi:hypothetical protein